jgi:hypothetical protein
MEIPQNFRTIVSDFTNDLSITFSEYAYLWEKWRNPDLSESDLTELFHYCVKVYPERFFDILYQKEEIFHPNDDTKVDFLPNVNFKLLYSCEDVSQQTKKTIWKYLQLILFTIVGGVKDKESFGDAANMFEGMGEGELNEKLAEAMGSITDFFKNMENMMGDLGGEEGKEDKKDEKEDEEKSPFEDFKKRFGGAGMPDIGKLQEHLKTLFDGKIGKLAKEMAEEISEEFSDLLGKDGTDIKNPQDVIKKLMKDPSKMMNLMKTVGSKLDNKMKSGEISREELMKEASEMMDKMKDMGGGDQFNDMFKNLAKNMGSMGKNMKVDTNALDRMTKMMSTKERLRAKAEQKKQNRVEEQAQQIAEMKKRMEEQEKLLAKYSLESRGENNLVFKLDGVESQERSFIHPDLLKEIAEEEAKKNSAPTKKKKKKGKK